QTEAIRAQVIGHDGEIIRALSTQRLNEHGGDSYEPETTDGNRGSRSNVLHRLCGGISPFINHVPYATLMFIISTMVRRAYGTGLCRRELWLVPQVTLCSPLPVVSW